MANVPTVCACVPVAGVHAHHHCACRDVRTVEQPAAAERRADRHHLCGGALRPVRNKQTPLATKNLLEVTDGLRRQKGGVTQSISALSMR